MRAEDELSESETEPNQPEPERNPEEGDFPQPAGYSDEEEMDGFSESSHRTKMVTNVFKWLNNNEPEDAREGDEKSLVESLAESGSSISLIQQLLDTMSGLGVATVEFDMDAVADETDVTDESDSYIQSIGFTGVYGKRKVVGKIYDAMDPSLKTTEFALEEFDRHQNVIRLMLAHNFMYIDQTQKDPIQMKALVFLRPIYTFEEFINIMSSFDPVRCLTAIFRQLMLLLDVIHSHSFILGGMNPSSLWIDLFDAPSRSDDLEIAWDFDRNRVPDKKMREIIVKVQDFSWCRREPYVCRSGMNAWALSKGLLDQKAYHAYEQSVIKAASDTKSLALVYAYMDMLVSKGYAGAMKVAQDSTQRVQVYVGTRISADCANRLNNLMWNLMDGNISEKEAKKHCFFFDEAAALDFLKKLVTRMPTTAYDIQNSFDGEPINKPNKFSTKKNYFTDNSRMKLVCPDTDARGNPMWFKRLGPLVTKYVESNNANSSASKSNRINDGEGGRSVSSSASGLKPATFTQTQTFYRYDSVYGVVELIRNLYHHPVFPVILEGDFKGQQPVDPKHRDYDAALHGRYWAAYAKEQKEMDYDTSDLKRELGERPKQFMNYFLHRYPALLTVVYCHVHQKGEIEGFAHIENLQLYEPMYTVSDVNGTQQSGAKVKRINFIKRQFE